MLLLGRANNELPVRNYSGSDRPLLRLKYVEECIAQWWEQFRLQNFSSLVPRQKWFEKHRNMCKGDVVLISYEAKSKPGTYRLGVVRDVTVDSDGLVRTVLVEYSLLSEVESSERHSFRGVTKKKIQVPIQRLILILSAEEQVSFYPGGEAESCIGRPLVTRKLVLVHLRFFKYSLSCFKFFSSAAQCST